MTATTTRPDWADLRVPCTRLVELGIKPEVATTVAKGEDSIAWSYLVQVDGVMALAALPDDKLAAIGEALREDGAPAPMTNTAAGIGAMVWVAAEMVCPTTPGWHSKALQSAVAAATLLRLAEHAWGKKTVITDLSPADRRWLNTH